MNQDQFDRVTVASPLYVFAVTQPCYSCGADLKAISIATESLVDHECDDQSELDGEVFVLTNIESLPAEVMAHVHACHPQYRAAYSQTEKLEYLMTVCHCGAHQGDFYVNKVLFNAACYEPESITVEKLQVEGRWEIDCSYSVGSAYDELVRKSP